MHVRRFVLLTLVAQVLLGFWSAVATNAAVLNSQQVATFPFSDDFESGIGSNWVVEIFNGVVETNTDYHYSGTKSVFLGQRIAGAISVSLVLPIDLTQQKENVFLDFWALRVGSPGFPTTTGVFISADEGVTWKQVLQLNNTAESFSHYLINITSANLPLNNKFRIRFTYDITSSNLNSGLIIDDVRLTTQANEFATFPYNQNDFETEAFRQGLYPQSWGKGIVEFNTDYHRSGNQSVFLGQKEAGAVSASLVMAVDLTGQTDVFLDFWVLRVGSPGFPTTTGVFISADEGVNWKQALGLSNTAQGFSHHLINITSADLPFNNKFRIRFTYDITSSNLNSGLIIDDVKLIKTSISGKIYEEEVTAGNEVAGAFVQICNDNNSCQTTTSQDGGSYQFGDLPAGTYKLRALPPAGNTHLIGNLGPITLVADTPLVDQHIILPKANGIPAGTTVTPALPPIAGVPTINWTTSVLLTHKGCASGTATYQVYVDGAIAREGAMPETPAGTYSVTLAPFRPVHGNIQLLITLRCPSGTQPPPINFNIWIDPSGFVVNTFGIPVAGAKVSLYRADVAEGPFDLVTSGSAIMSPANRVNPMNTDSTGRFGWDVIAGYYRVRAEKAGCTAPGSNETFAETLVLTIPPPVTDLRLILDCGGSAVFLPTVRR